MSMQSLKKIGQKVHKLEHGNEALTDRQTDGWTLKVRRVQHNTPPLFVWRGIKTTKHSPPIPHLLQAQQVPALPYAKVVGRPGTGSYPAP